MVEGWVKGVIREEEESDTQSQALRGVMGALRNSAS
jgi:hypothetical protein